MHALVPVIIIIIIALQIFFFVKNLLRMNLFSNIFSKEKSWSLRKNSETGLVDGVYGNGNSIFDSIIDSINKYLGNNSGSVIDFGLLKDAVDRHCDSVEDDIATQTPIPLYWGLAGTMAGVILGLWDLLDSNAINTLMGSAGSHIQSASNSAANGIDALLSGVAWAMVASICGIILTTLNSLLFKKCKLKEESGKNSFLAWMQAELLPELPSDTSQALNNLVKNLNKFNSIFADNTTNLRDALGAVNESYAIQANIIQAVHDMDVMKMAKANVRVLEELQNCTDKLEYFNQYLIDIKGYTDEIHRFEKLFDQSVGRYQVLEEIRDFFHRHKDEIAKTTADADNALQSALSELKESSGENIEELNKNFTKQSEQFKKTLNEEKEAFEEFIGHMRTQFSAQMSQMPTLQRQLEEISSIPSRLDKLIEKIEKSNSKMVADIANAFKQVKPNAPVMVNPGSDGAGGGFVAESSIPSWMKFTGWVALVVIALACIFNVVTTIFPISHGATGNYDSGEAMDSAVESTAVIEVVDSLITVEATSVADSATSSNLPYGINR
ncbi:MAG: apolipoprotein A1/A4/E family protein [Bacteroidales bacterium]|nr:apolipoprotein A1/A4/E family protein [Bacteroidales bacterium]